MSWTVGFVSLSALEGSQKCARSFGSLGCTKASGYEELVERERRENGIGGWTYKADGSGR
jgi:hypothetical protein